jgi:hypothetical protein
MPSVGRKLVLERRRKIVDALPDLFTDPDGRSMAYAWALPVHRERVQQHGRRARQAHSGVFKTQTSACRNPSTRRPRSSSKAPRRPDRRTVWSTAGNVALGLILAR